MKLLSTCPSALVFIAGVLAGGAQTAYAGSQNDFASDRNFCASYGAGFVPVEGTRTCVRIGGHVRIEMDVVRPLRLDDGASFQTPSAGLTAVSSPQGPLQR